MTARLHPTDRSIVAALRSNARMSISELAGRVGVSRATAKARLDALVSDGRIRRFTVETDVDVDGGIRAIALVELQGSMSRAVVRALSRIPEVHTVYATNGAWDLVVEIRTYTLPAFDRALREIREIPGVRNSQSNLLLSRVFG